MTTTLSPAGVALCVLQGQLEHEQQTIDALDQQIASLVRRRSDAMRHLRECQASMLEIVTRSCGDRSVGYRIK